MKVYKKFINECYYIFEKYSDEHAHRKVWNHFIVHKKHGSEVRTHLNSGEHEKALSHMKGEIEKAKSNPSHPLSFEKAKRGFAKSGKTDADRKSYHKELEDAVHGVYALSTHKKIKGAVDSGHPARVTGGSDPNAKLSKGWKGAGGSNKTPKSDLEIYNPKNPKERRGISMKKGGGSQLASAEPGEMRATYRSAAKAYVQRFHGDKSKEERNKIKSDIENRANRASKLFARMKTGSDSGNDLRKRAAQRHVDKIHSDHPQMTRLVTQASTSGNTKFSGRNSPGTAGIVLTGRTSKTPATAKSAEQQSSSKPRAAKPKGSNRAGNLKVDYRG